MTASTTLGIQKKPHAYFPQQKVGYDSSSEQLIFDIVIGTRDEHPRVKAWFDVADLAPVLVGNEEVWAALVEARREVGEVDTEVVTEVILEPELVEADWDIEYTIEVDGAESITWKSHLVPSIGEYIHPEEIHLVSPLSDPLGFSHLGSPKLLVKEINHFPENRTVLTCELAHFEN